MTPLHCDVWLPTVVAVNGVCTGAGFTSFPTPMSSSASSKASFLDTHVSVGQVAAVEPISLLPRIGLGNALRLTVLGRHGRLPRTKRCGSGWSTRSSIPTCCWNGLSKWRSRRPPVRPAAIEGSKRAIRGALELPIGDALQAGWELLLAHRDHPDSVEGPIAFAEKREPKWQ